MVLRVADGAAGGLASTWSPAVLLRHDVLVVFALFLVDAALARRTPRLPLLIYAAVAGWCAINVPIARVFSTPLTLPMLGAAGTAIADSIRVYVTIGNTASVLVIVAVAVLAPRALMRWGIPSPRHCALFAIVGIGLVCAGSFVASRVPTVGLHRNAVSVLIGSALDRFVAPTNSGELPPEPPLPAEGTALDLSRFAGAAQGRNVIWINLESTAATYLAPWRPPTDNGADPMPSLTAFARDAWVFDSIYAAHPESIKGLFAMLCATSPAAHTDAAQYTEAHLPCDPIASRLHSAGYRTALVHSGWFAYLGMRGVVANRGFDTPVDAGDIASRYRSSFGVDEPATVERTLAWIDEQRSNAQPFFLMYLPIAGHHPYNAPGPSDEPHPFGRTSDLDEYKNDLFRGDRSLARLIDGVRARGLDDKTLWVIVGDHGEAFQQHPGNFAHTLFVYEENVHVPLVLRAKGITDAGARVPQIGGTIDIAPTVLALLGLPAPAAWQGHSLLDGKPGSARFYVDQAVWLAGLRSGPWKYILDLETGRSQLFNLDDDRAEQRDLSNTEAARVRRYREHVSAWAVRQRALVSTGRNR